MSTPMKILVIGPGPFAIGEGAELDAATTRAAARLRELGHDVAILSSNPAACCASIAGARTYLEPLDVEGLAAVALRERPDRVYPLAGGRRALELARAVREGRVEGLGAANVLGAIAFEAEGGAAARADLGDAWVAVDVVIATDGTRAAKVCSVESLDRASVHPGDAVSVMPAHTLAAADLAAVEAAAAEAARTAGTGIYTISVVVERGSAAPRVLDVCSGTTRTSALASAVGSWDLAALDVDLALGRALPEGLPTIDGIVARWPRFAFETFPDAETALGPRRKSLGDALGAGTTLAAALRSAARGADDGLVSARSVRPAPGVDARRVVVVGAGPARIGAGPELSSCLVEALRTCREHGDDPILVDASLDTLVHREPRARIAPVTLDHVLGICRSEATSRVILQLGGDTALRLAAELQANGISVLGTPPEALARLAARPAEPALAADATTFDVEAISDGKRVVIAGVAEHLEPAFVHGGDAAAMVPPTITRPDIVVAIEDLVRSVGIEHGIVGFLAVRVAVEGDRPRAYAIEPRAGRTTAFVSRATGVPIVDLATKVILGATLDDLGVTERALPRHVSVRERVFPFERLGVDPALGSEMRSTGEVIGIAGTAARAYGKALRAIGLDVRAPASGATPSDRRGVLLDLTERDRSAGVELARRLRNARFELLVCGGTRATLAAARIPFKDLGDDETAAVTEVREGRVALAIVTSRSDAEIARTRAVRSAALATRIPCFTTIALARLGCATLEEEREALVRPLEEWYAASSGT
ncbi:MAG: hypothetical protein JST00_03205 [Deltaproteobacteria bacterium]|nr:hypothetical protein [Deltaproteobacteria bacterium]